MMERAWLPVAAIAVALVLFLVLFSGSIYTVNQTEQVIITQFGKPVGDPITEQQYVERKEQRTQQHHQSPGPGAGGFK